MNDKQPAKILFLIDKQSHCDRFAGLLGDIEPGVDWRWIKDIQSLKDFHKEETCDLVLYWHQRNLVDESELVKCIESLEEGPVLILVADHIEPRDFIHAGKLNAADVINAGMLAQFAFVVRRELASVHTRRKLVKAIDDLTGERIVDESTLDTHVEVGNMNEVVEILDDAIKNNKFELLFQPIVAVQNDGCDNFEAFLRIRHKGDFIRPDDFLPVAKKYGLMPPIDKWVVKNAVRRYKAEQEVRKIRKNTDRQLKLFINVSGHSLADEEAIGIIVTEIVQAKLSPGSLVVEIDKHTIMSRLQDVKALNQNLKKLQLEFAIDHYEESDTSLNYLKHLTVDYLKIDGHILNEIHKDTEKREAVRRIVQKAREEKIRVIGSQVENADVLPILYGLGVDYIQGYLLGEPGTRLEHQALDDTTLTGSFERVVI